MASIPVEAMREDVASIFLSYLNRAPEYSAMSYFVGRYAQILEEQGDSPAAEPDAFKLLSAEIYSVAGEVGEIPSGPAVTDAEYVAWLYENVLGREGEPEGLAYWTAQVESGALERAELVAVFIDSAQGDDVQYIANRTTVALEFAKFENSNDAILGSLPYNAAQVLEGVTADEATVEAALEKVTTGAVTGDSFMLTSDIDNVSGTDLNDVVTAILGTVDGIGATLTAFDKVDGKGGSDTLDIYSDGTTTVPVTASVQNVETVNFRYMGDTAEGTVQAGRFAGVQELWQIGAATDVAGVGVNTTVGLRDVTLSSGSAAVDAVPHVAAVTVTNSSSGFGLNNFRSVTIDGQDFSGGGVLVSASDALNQLIANINGAGLGIVAAVASGTTGVTLTAASGTAFEVTNAVSVAVTTEGSEAVDAVDPNEVAVDFMGASGKIALDNVGFAAGEISGALTASGAALASLDVSGELAEDNSLLLDVNAGASVETFTLNSEVDTVLGDLSGAVLRTLDASGTTGDLTHVGSETLANITAGEGNDDVTLSTAFATGLTSASVNGGAGDDRLVVQATNAAANVAGAAITVSGGAGDDEIIVNVVNGAANGVRVTVDAGEGDDIVRIQDGEGGYRALTDNDVLDGGAGTDTLAVGVATTVLNAGDYVRLQDVSNFENLRFEDIVGENGNEVDAAELDNFTQIEVTGDGFGADMSTDGGFDLDLGNGSNSFVKNISADQTIIVRGGAVLYGADDELNVTVLSDADVGLFAATANVTVDTTEAQDSVSFYIGDYAPSELESLNLTLVSTFSGVNDYVAYADIDAADAGANFTSLTVSGTGSVEVDNEDGALTTIDTSGLGGTYLEGGAFDGLYFEGSLAVAESVTVGSGLDEVYIRSEAGSTSLVGMDTYTGLTLALSAEGDNFGDESDEFYLELEDLQSTAEAFVVATFDAAPSSLGAALNTVSALEDNAVVFSFGGDTYLFVENESESSNSLNENFEASDFVVKLTGSYDLDDLATLATLSLTPELG